MHPFQETVPHSTQAAGIQLQCYNANTFAPFNTEVRKSYPKKSASFGCSQITSLRCYLHLVGIEKTERTQTCAWYKLSVLALCNGISTFIKNCLCSAFRGNAKPLIMLQEKCDRNNMNSRKNCGTNNFWMGDRVTNFSLWEIISLISVRGNKCLRFFCHSRHGWGLTCQGFLVILLRR